MPYSPAKPCTRPGCGALTHERFCQQHQREEYRRQDERRGSASARGYDARWRRLRAMVLAREPLCRLCRATGRVVEAVEVDHIVRKRAGGRDELDNLQPLCRPCHSAKTARESLPR
jgi:5-methylcytosine-specific restriction enzyme A